MMDTTALSQHTPPLLSPGSGTSLKKPTQRPTPAAKEGIVLGPVAVDRFTQPTPIPSPRAPSEASDNRPSEDDIRLSHFATIFGSKAATAAFNEFLDNIFIQINSDRFVPLVQELRKDHQDYASFYESLLNGLKGIKKPLLGNLKDQLFALDVVTQTIVGQTASLCGKGVTVDGMAEIGYPGRLIRALGRQTKMQLSKNIYVINDAERLGDYIQSGFPRPYRTFVPLQDYAPISRSIPAASLDLVICPIGLHHIPPHRLEPFIDGVAKVLRPGGAFVLRDHDAYDTYANAMANVVHSVFNAATGVAFADEISEVRDFKSISTWVKLLAKHGMSLDQKPILTDGDPSRNALMRFTKMGTGRQEAIKSLDRAARLSSAEYCRPAGQTFATTAEWHLVALAQEYADYLKSLRTPASFPYLKTMATMVEVGKSSIKEAEGKTSFDYKLMNVFMIFSTVFELAWRAVCFAPLAASRQGGRLLHGVDVFTQNQLAYADFITHTPFFEFPYLRHALPMWKGIFSNGLTAIPINAWLAMAVCLEALVKTAVSLPLSWMYQGGDTSKLYAMIDDPNQQASHLLGDNSVLRRGEHGLAVVEVPRYGPLVATIDRLTQAGVKMVNIAGQKEVQIKVLIPPSSTLNFDEMEGAFVLGEIPMHASAGDRFVRLKVAIPNMQNTISAIRNQGAKIEFIHDF